MVFAERSGRRWLPGGGGRRLFRPQQGTRLRLNGWNLYILPTGFGFLWLTGAGVLQLVGIQQQSNGPLFMSFLLLGLFVLALHLTAGNLQGLELACGEPAAGFAGDPLPYPLQIRSRFRRYQVELSFEPASRSWGALQGRGEARGLVIEPGDQWLAIAWPASRRGLQRPGTLRVRSTAPLGLFRCWSLWQPEVAQLVYPAQRPGPVLERSSAPLGPEAEAAGSGLTSGAGDWCDLRPHRAEEGVARLAWKTLARGRGAHNKVFDAPAPQACWLSPQPGLAREQALEHLCERLCRFSAAGLPFGLAVGEQTIAPGLGPRHRDRCLAVLALLP